MRLSKALWRGSGSTLAVATLATLAGGSVATADAARPYDMDGDGAQELVVGMPWWTDQGAAGAGAVAVVSGGKRLVITQHTIGSTPKHLDGFGTGLASGDFDRDGRADLAIGAPGGGSTARPGTVTVLYGGEDFPSGRRAVLPGPASTTPYDYPGFGSALVAGDLNRDGYADLAVGTPGEAPLQEADYGSGAIRVLYGGPAGLTGAGSTVIARTAATDNGFGRHLALGDLDRDGHLDVLEGEPGQPHWVDDPAVPGHLSIAAGSSTGPVAATAIRSRMRGGARSLATGDVTGDGYADLVAGVPVNRFVGEDQDAPAGAVLVFRGGKDGVTRTPIVIEQRSPGVPGTNEAGDRFGSSVAVARIDGDRYADIVVGADGEDSSRGRVTLVRGGRLGHARSGNTAFDRSTRGIRGERRRGDRFGSLLSVLDHDGDGRRDLAIVAAGEHATDPGLRAGSVTVLYGSGNGLAAAGSDLLRLSTLGQAPALGDVFPDPTIGRTGGS